MRAFAVKLPEVIRNTVAACRVCGQDCRKHACCNVVIECVRARLRLMKFKLAIAKRTHFYLVRQKKVKFYIFLFDILNKKMIQNF